MFKKAAVAIGLLAGCAAAARADECPHQAAREATVPAGGARVVRIQAGAGALKIQGRAGSDAVVVHGKACAGRASLVDDVQVKTSQEGDAVVVEAVIPESTWLSGGGAWLDLVIEVPAHLAVDASDGSGSAEIAGVGALTVEDGSGELTIRDVAREVRIRDGSGSIEIQGVGGSVTVDVDGSGSIDARQVKGSVVVKNDGSGSIAVADVGGDFSVRRDGSGGIEHHDVRGQVSIPDKR
jgi:hypothetical protein